MNLSEYEKQIEEIEASDLSDAAKGQALNLTANEISGAAWQSHAQERAVEVAGKARAAAGKYATRDPLAGFDELASKGLLERKRG